LKINQRKLKRLKNKMWRIYKRKHGILGRIKTTNIVATRSGELYKQFYATWQKLKNAYKDRPQLLAQMTEAPVLKLYGLLYE